MSGPDQLIPQSDEAAQQIATSRALATAKDILQNGGTQAEAAEGAKAVARKVLREFQLAQQAEEDHAAGMEVVSQMMPCFVLKIYRI